MFTRPSVLGFALTALVAGCSGMRPSQLGVQEGKLVPCPPSPNCVSTQSPDSEHFVAPLKFTTTAPDAAADLKKVILGMKRARIVREYDSYLHAEYTSLIWRFVDDVEFYLDDSTKTVHIRSASRLGRSDFGVNRKRVEEIRALWTSSAQ